MIKADIKGLASGLTGALDGLRKITGTKEKAAQNAIAKALGAGATIIARAAKSAAPKGKRVGKGGVKRYGKTGLLKKSIKAKSGISKQGTAYAVVGPSRDVMEDSKRGRGMARARPSNYAHLVEFGFKAHHRVPGVRGRQQENIVKKGVMWKGVDLAKYNKKHATMLANMSVGKLRRVLTFMGSTGQGSTQVPARPFIAPAYAASMGAAGEAIMARYETELNKLLKASAKRGKE